MALTERASRLGEAFLRQARETGQAIAPPCENPAMTTRSAPTTADSASTISRSCDLASFKVARSPSSIRVIFCMNQARTGVVRTMPIIR